MHDVCWGRLVEEVRDSPMFHCIYTSVEAYPLTEAEITRLVQDSRVKNASHDISGVLLHVQNTFFQVLEGPQEAIDQLWNSILRDRRHTHVTRIIYEPIARRYFGGQAMELTTLSPFELAELLEQGDSARREELLSDIDEGRAKRLIRAFSDGRWRSRSRPQAVPQEEVRV